MKYTIDSMRVPNGPVSITSLLIPIDEFGVMSDKYRDATIVAAVEKAEALFGVGQRLTVRDLNGSDMSYTANIMTETSNATANAWNAMAFGAFTVATGTVVGIYGLKLYVVHDATIDFCPITGVRIDVGGARVAQWHVQSLDQNTSAASVAPTRAYCGITKSPVVAGEDITVTIYEYTRTASTVYTPCWLGVTVEKEGITLRP